jgi:hypothetical protein
MNIYEKRKKALQLLEEFKSWTTHPSSTGNSVVLLGLTRDILHGSESEVDYLIENLKAQNHTYLMKKLKS